MPAPKSRIPALGTKRSLLGRYCRYLLRQLENRILHGASHNNHGQEGNGIGHDRSGEPHGGSAFLLGSRATVNEVADNPFKSAPLQTGGGLVEPGFKPDNKSANDSPRRLSATYTAMPHNGEMSPGALPPTKYCLGLNLVV